MKTDSTGATLDPGSTVVYSGAFLRRIGSAAFPDVHSRVGHIVGDGPGPFIRIQWEDRGLSTLCHPSDLTRRDRLAHEGA